LGTAQAGTVLFPQIAVSPTITTVISVMNAGDGFLVNKARPSEESLHYQYFYKRWESIADNQTVCDKYDDFLPTSKNDIQTMDFGGAVFGVGNRSVLYEDPAKFSVRNNWDVGTVDYGMANGLSDAKGVIPAQRGFLLVSNDSTDPWANLAGEAFFIDIANGASWGYQAFQNATAEDYNFDWVASSPNSLVSIMDPNEITTKFLVTVIDDDIVGDSHQGRAYDEEVMVGTRILNVNGTVEPGIYNRDEGPKSGSTDKPVVCVGALTITDLLPNIVVNTEVGGWTNITNYEREGTEKSPGSARPSAAIFKVEFGTEIDGVPVGGTFNTGTYLHPGSY
jgi:hypothetical protein